MPAALDVTGDDIWFGGLLVGRLLLPTSSIRDEVEFLIQQSPLPFEEQLSALEAEHDETVKTLEAEHDETVKTLEDQLAAAENEADALRETLDTVEIDGAATVLKDLTDALRIALADNDKLRDAARKLQEERRGESADA